jgi:RNA polymerase sigma-70 factor, ECF subfamily
MIDDQKLIKQYQCGSESAFNELVNKHQGWVRNFIQSSTIQKQDAEDISQDIFVKVYFGLHKFRFESEFKTWLYRIIMNQMNNYYRKQKLISWFSFDITETTQPEYNESNEEESRLKELIIIVKRLPKMQRNIITLRVYQDLPFKQIAEILSITENSAKVSFYKAKSNIKRGFNDSN